MSVYVCDECGFDYDPEIGDPENGVEPGVTFKRLPSDWVCPECGGGKNQFTPVPDDEFADDHSDEDEGDEY